MLALHPFGTLNFGRGLNLKAIPPEVGGDFPIQGGGLLEVTRLFIASGLCVFCIHPCGTQMQRLIRIASGV